MWTSQIGLAVMCIPSFCPAHACADLTFSTPWLDFWVSIVLERALSTNKRLSTENELKMKDNEKLQLITS